MGGVSDLALRDHDFAATIDMSAPVTLRLGGSADGTISAPLTEFLGTVHVRLTGAGVRAVVVDIRALEFMSAACFNALVGWLALIIELPPEARYHLEFESNPAIPWQRRSLDTLACFATDVVTVDPVEA